MYDYIFIITMEKRTLFDTKKIVGTGLLTALLIALQALSMVIPTGVNLNLSLIPITIGAILYGPLVGAFLGLVSGGVVLLSPNTVTFFMAISPVGTVIACLVKTTVAGLMAGFIYKWLNKVNDNFAVILASVSVPLLNTLIFAVCTNIFFMGGLADLGVTNFIQIFTILIGFNFIFEIITNTIISPIIYRVLKVVKKGT